MLGSRLPRGSRARREGGGGHPNRWPFSGLPQTAIPGKARLGFGDGGPVLLALSLQAGH